ncbi:hypothetical protein [Paraburkholderia nemoris]|uniref:hypothetical protein n=1 Tax=Paraburkholderia nemoris TaxID=2793076 RepID=UPI001B1AB8FC|nr:hypothetical protein [Paraburkholderia nemoris]CAE6838025.1 hypothetical protein R75777_06928 [Paraburkholderia nemoris]
MDRPTVYTQEQGRSVDFLFAQRATMIGVGKLAQAAFGSNTVVHGLAVTPNSPAALNVLVGIGEIYSTQQVDATPWGALPADTTDMITKQGLNMAAQTISTPAPTTSGFSINYLIEAQYQDQDTNAAVLPYYNSSNPQIPLNGQGGNGAPQSTQRQGVCVIQAKAGVAAATGTQVTPTVDSGWTALAVVTVANGQATVTSGNISVPAGVPQLTSLLQMMQTESTNYALDTSATPNQITIALTPPITAYTDGMQLNFRAANNSSGAVNINAGPGNISLSGAAGALQTGEIVVGGYYSAVYQSNSGTAVLVGQGAGAEQVNPATQPKHAAQFGQLGALQSLAASVASNALTLTLNAPTPLWFRNATLTNGVPNSVTLTSNLSLTVPSGATLGTISAQSARLAWLVAYNGGSPALCVVNLAGGVNLDETTLISATAISSGATSASTIYSASAITNSPFRVVGFTDITETTAGTWATGPTTVQGAGGEALAALSSIGYGQTWQSFTSGTRPLATTFYNTTGRPIQVSAAGQSSNTNAYIQLVVNGVAIIGSTAATALTICTVTAIVPSGGSYLANMPVGGATWSAWTELR